MSTFSKLVNDSIVVVMEKEHPELCNTIKELAIAGESYKNFKCFLNNKLPKTSILYPASLTLFKHYKKCSQ